VYPCHPRCKRGDVHLHSVLRRGVTDSSSRVV
jgi:hypothetical protein